MSETLSSAVIYSTLRMPAGLYPVLISVLAFGSIIPNRLKPWYGLESGWTGLWASYVHDGHEFVLIIKVRRRARSRPAQRHTQPQSFGIVSIDNVFLNFFYFLLNRKGWVQEGFFLQPSPELRYRGLRESHSQMSLHRCYGII